MAYDPNNPEDVKRAEEADKLAALQLDADMKKVLDSRAGRNVLWWLLSQTNIYGSAFTGNSTTFFNEGKREVGLRLLARITEADVTAYPKMMMEFSQNG